MHVRGQLDLNAAIFKSDECLESQFCALAYRPKPESDAPPSVESIILLVVKNENGNLRFLVSPTFREVVQGHDLAYIDSLLNDFIERAKLDPVALIQQLCSLGVGPLVTQEAGPSLAAHPALLELCRRFIQL
jgi:hypothetical protein